MMKKYLLTIIVILFLVLSPIGGMSSLLRVMKDKADCIENYQPPQLIDAPNTWMKTFGGMASDEAHAIHQTNDGGYLITGTTYSYGPGGRNGWLLKLDAYGIEEWNKTYRYNIFVEGADCIQISDGSYILVGTTNFDLGINDILLLKIDESGNEEWHKTIGGPLSDYGLSIITCGEGYILGGSTNSFGSGGFDLWLVKVDSDGNELWNKTYGTKCDNYYSSMRKTVDNGYILCGWGDDIYIVKTDESGNEEWHKTYGGSDREQCYDVLQTSDGGYVILGCTWSVEDFGDFGAILFKTNQVGEVEWYKLYNKDDYRSIQKISDGSGFILTGPKESFFYEREVRLTTINGNGKIRWSRTYGTTNNDWGEQVQLTTDGGYVIVGGTHPPPPKSWYDIIVIKTNQQGRINSDIHFSKTINYLWNLIKKVQN